jgi:hypothetical protein
MRECGAGDGHEDRLQAGNPALKAGHDHLWIKRVSCGGTAIGMRPRPNIELSGNL